jgi:hypothetical protein
MVLEGVLLFVIFAVLLVLRVPVAFALMFAGIMLFFADERLVPPLSFWPCPCSFSPPTS